MKEAFEKIVERFKVQQKKHIEDYDRFGDGEEYRISLIYEHAIEIVNQVAEEYALDINVGNNNGWIPCSERLPEKNVNVLVCDGNGLIEICCLTNGLSWMDNYADLWLLSTFIAWQPLPEPYKPKGE